MDSPFVAFCPHRFKNTPSLPASEQAVSCVPEVVCKGRLASVIQIWALQHIFTSMIADRLSEDDFLFIATDGVWDVMQNIEVVNFFNDYINSGEFKYSELVLLRYCFDLSTDASLGRDKDYGAACKNLLDEVLAHVSPV
jgi:hypothetical protein